MSITEIVEQPISTGILPGDTLRTSLSSGQVEMRRFGMAKIYMLSRRVPLSAVTFNIFRHGLTAG